MMTLTAFTIERKKLGIELPCACCELSKVTLSSSKTVFVDHATNDMLSTSLKKKKKCVELPETSKQQFDSSYSIQRILRNLWIDQDVVQLTSFIPIFRARFALEQGQSKR